MASPSPATSVAARRRRTPGTARARVVIGALVAIGVHVPLLVALRMTGREEKVSAPVAEVADLASSVESRRAAVRTERAALLETAEADVSARRVLLGDTLIRLGWADGVLEGGAADRAELARALGVYDAILADVRAGVAAGAPVERAIVDAIAREGRAGRYKRMYPRLADALVHGGGNCVALSTLATALAFDAGRGGDAEMRVYSNHVAPDVAGFRFGMAKRCHGPGVAVPAKDLVGAYVRARAIGDREPFAFPRASEGCDDPGDVFGGLQLVGMDPPPLPVVAAAARDPDCRRRTVLEEYEDDVEVLGADGRSLGGVGVPRAASLDLEGHATSAACLDRRAASVADVAGAGGAADPAPLVLALGDAAMAAEEAARVFAEAGELDVAREYERRLGEYRARAAAPLERVIGRLADPDADVAEVLAGAGRLVALGEGGRTAMLLAAERHRGFWELANLMTRPSSQLGALRRWSEKPVDVQLDVIDALPCASETFLAQLDAMKPQAARALHDACDVRTRVDKETCMLDEALVRVRERGRTRGASREAGDLAEAVLVRHLSARCRTPAFVDAARRWAASKPAPVARALATRLAAP